MDVTVKLIQQEENDQQWLVALIGQDVEEGDFGSITITSLNEEELTFAGGDKVPPFSENANWLFNTSPTSALLLSIVGDIEPWNSETDLNLFTLDTTSASIEPEWINPQVNNAAGEVITVEIEGIYGDTW